MRGRLWHGKWLRSERRKRRLSWKRGLARSGATLVLEAIAAEEAGTLTALPQEHAAATRAPKMKKDDGQIDWNRRAEEIVNQVRALVPWPKTYTHWFRDTKNPLRMIVEKVAVESGERPARPGEVIEAAGDRLLVGTGEGLLRVEQLQPAGKKSLPRVHSCAVIGFLWANLLECQKAKRNRLLASPAPTLPKTRARPVRPSIAYHRERAACSPRPQLSGHGRMVLSEK